MFCKSFDSYARPVKCLQSQKYPGLGLSELCPPSEVSPVTEVPGPGVVGSTSAELSYELCSASRMTAMSAQFSFPSHRYTMAWGCRKYLCRLCPPSLVSPVTDIPWPGVVGRTSVELSYELCSASHLIAMPAQCSVPSHRNTRAWGCRKYLCRLKLRVMFCKSFDSYARPVKCLQSQKYPGLGLKLRVMFCKSFDSYVRPVKCLQSQKYPGLGLSELCPPSEVSPVTEVPGPGVVGSTSAELSYDLVSPVTDIPWPGVVGSTSAELSYELCSASRMTAMSAQFSFPSHRYTMAWGCRKNFCRVKLRVMFCKSFDSYARPVKCLQSQKYLGGGCRKNFCRVKLRVMFCKSFDSYARPVKCLQSQKYLGLGLSEVPLQS
ncbi:hypothetical protein J6590_028126 [Homalodisca vitripennis]|nr:hypothetical protein J6590_028126 [Homalodisca vitripennis]